MGAGKMSCDLVARVGRPWLPVWPLRELALPLRERALPLRGRALPLRGRALPLRERALPLRELALPLRERALPLGERALPLGERALPLRRAGRVLGASVQAHGMQQLSMMQRTSWKAGQKRCRGLTILPGRACAWVQEALRQWTWLHAVWRVLLHHLHNCTWLLFFLAEGNLGRGFRFLHKWCNHIMGSALECKVPDVHRK
jgi:hypothetical protein